MRAIDADALIADCQLAQKQADRHGREFANAFYSGGGEISTEWWCVEDMIENAPTIEPEQRWIPCSEETGDGYPEEDGFYYVTEQNYGFYLDADYKQRVTHTSHFKNGDFIDRFYAENNSNITAWMPLPEPYAERRQDESEKM